jgi:phosphohistidine phosphatase SixA
MPAATFHRGVRRAHIHDIADNPTCTSICVVSHVPSTNQLTAHLLSSKLFTCFNTQQPIRSPPALLVCTHVAKGEECNLDGRVALTARAGPPAICSAVGAQHRL